MLSVITPTIRPELLHITEDTLKAQTFTDYEWLVEVGDPAEGFTLPRDFNSLIGRATGDIIVILEDCITIPPDALERISTLNYESKTAYTFPVGKKQQGEDKGGGRLGITWDWRKLREKATGQRTIPQDHWEIDFAAAPRGLFTSVGGFDEDFCRGWSWENVEIAYRASLLGWKFEVSTVTEGVAFDHDAAMPHPFRGKLENNDVRATQSRVMADGGRIVLDFL